LDVATPRGGSFGWDDVQFVPGKERVYRGIVFDAVHAFRPFGRSLRERMPEEKFPLAIPLSPIGIKEPGMIGVMEPDLGS
jgi:hypothetical protein